MTRHPIPEVREDVEPEKVPRRTRPADKRRRFLEHPPGPVSDDGAPPLENTPDGHDG